MHLIGWLSLRGLVALICSFIWAFFFFRFGLPDPRKINCLRQVLLKGQMRPTVSELAGKNAGRTCPCVKSLPASTQLWFLGRKYVLGGGDYCSFLFKFSACRIPSLQRVSLYYVLLLAMLNVVGGGTLRLCFYYYISSTYTQ